MPDAVQPSPPSVERPSWTPPDPSRWGALRVIAFALVLFAAGGMAALMAGLGARAEPGLVSGPVERWAPVLAWAALVGSPALLIAMSTRRRGVLLLPAGVLLLGLVSMTFFIGFPLVVPGVLVLVAFGTRWDGAPCGPVRAVAAGVVVVVLVVAAWCALWVHHDPRTYGDCVVTMYGEGSASGWCPQGARGGGSTSDVVTPVEAVISMALVGAAMTAGWLIARPRRLRARTAG